MFVDHRGGLWRARVVIHCLRAHSPSSAMTAKGALVKGDEADELGRSWFRLGRHAGVATAPLQCLTIKVVPAPPDSRGFLPLAPSRNCLTARPPTARSSHQLLARANG
jgi:hypothetical protein